jgi:hypothetical protein
MIPMTTPSASSEPPALGPLLSGIHSPEDVKTLSDQQLPLLAALREEENKTLKPYEG